MKAMTITTLKGLLSELKLDGFRYGRYGVPVDVNEWETRDKSKAFRCIAYVSCVRQINALKDAIATLERLDSE